MEAKSDWRRRARLARLDLDLTDSGHVESLARFLAAPGRRSGWVVGYRAMAGEVDLSPLWSRPGLGPFALTRTPATGFDLTIHPLDSPSERHPYGFDQPAAGAPELPDDDLAVVLVPGLAFDRHGNRLGRGRGYYDRLLTRLGPAVVRVGVTGGYIVAELPVEPHDVTMTHLSVASGVEAVPLADPPG